MLVLCRYFWLKVRKPGPFLSIAAILEVRALCDATKLGICLCLYLCEKDAFDTARVKEGARAGIRNVTLVEESISREVLEMRYYHLDTIRV